MAKIVVLHFCQLRILSPHPRCHTGLATSLFPWWDCIELRDEKLMEAGIAAHELGECRRLHDPTGIHEENTIHVLQGGGPVTHHYNDLVFAELSQVSKDFGFPARVDRACRLIEDPDARVPQV